MKELDKNNNEIIIVRGTHPQEVSAFYLAKEVSGTLRQKGYATTLVTVPYDYSLLYLAAHASNVVSKYYEFMECPEELDDLKEREFYEELKKCALSSDQKDAWECNLNYTFPYAIIDKIIEKHKGKQIIDFHNYHAGDKIDKRDRDLISIFILANGHEGFVLSERLAQNYYTIEIPAFFKKVPQEILEGRKEVIDTIKRAEMHADDYLEYLENVVDFTKSKKEGLTSDIAVRKISEVIEEIIERPNKI